MVWIYVVLGIIHLSVLLTQIILYFTRDRAPAESNSSEIVAAADGDEVPVVPKYDVFLSYRKEDTGFNFTSHLYAALRGRRILTYIDDGEEMSESQLTAIRESRMAVVVFSQNYADSGRCLDELAEILRCRRHHNQVVYPVFFRVNPDDVGEQKGNYAAALKRHRKSSSALTRGRVKIWRDALEAAANLSGWDALVIKSDAELVKTVETNVLRTLNKMSPSPQFTGLVGVESRIEKIKSLLRTDSSSSSDHTRIIGIWGMGGMGKTTLARAIFDQLVTQFDGCHFLADVRRQLEATTELRLQQQLFSSILDDDQDFTTALSRTHLRRMRVLVVLDNVDDPVTLHNLLDKQPQTVFGPGSRILVTSRDHQVLNIVCDDIYEVEELDEDESLQLFRSIAFVAPRDDHLLSSEEYTEMSRKIVSYASGNPQALVVFGKALKDRTKEYWQSTLFRLQRIPNERIQRLLKVTYEGLDEDQKNGFLDIACLLKGESKEYVKSRLDGSYSFGSSEYIMASLADKSLVRFPGDDGGGERVEMHGLVKEMGRGIVNEESDDDDDDEVGGRRWLLSSNVSPLLIKQE